MDVNDAVTLAVRIAAMVAQLIAEEDAENEQILLAIGIAAEEVVEVMALEEEGLEILEGDAWTHVTVRRDDYHEMSDRLFRLHFRMGKGVFEALCETLQEHLIAQGRLRRHRTPFQDIVLMVVWILATPDSFRSVALRFGVSPGTLYFFYLYIIEALRELASRFITWPNQEERNRIKETFQQATGFSGVIGCIDGTHVYITAPVQTAVHYRNRHHSYSINVQAVVESNLLVRDLHVGEVGSIHDTRVFRRSPLSRSLLRGEGIGPNEHLVGDGGYMLCDFMMIPFKNNGHLTENQKNFNKRLSQSRVRVENAIGKAKGKWRRLKFLHASRQDVVVDHITASFVLHNFLILHGEPMFDDNELARPLNNAELLGDREIDEDIEENDEDERLRMAQAMGVEKREFIKDHVLPLMEEEGEEIE